MKRLDQYIGELIELHRSQLQDLQDDAMSEDERKAIDGAIAGLGSAIEALENLKHQATAQL